MTTRERWVVYPLLFLTLGIALRDKILPPAQFSAEKIRCNKLETAQAECQMVTAGSPAGNVGVRMGATANGGRLEVLGPSGKVLVLVGAELGGRAGFVETLTPNQVPLVQLGSSPSGGHVTTVGQGGQTLVITGHQGKSFGVFAQVPGLLYPIPLMSGPPRLITVPELPEKSPPDARSPQKSPQPPNESSKDAGSPKRESGWQQDGK